MIALQYLCIAFMLADLTSKSIEAATDLLTALADKLTFNQSDTQGANNDSAVLLDEMAAVVDLLTRDGQQDAWVGQGCK